MADAHETPSEAAAADPLAPPGPTGSRAVHPAAALVLALLLLAGLGALTLRLLDSGERVSPDEVDLSLPDWRPNPAEVRRLDKVADVRRAAAPPLDDPELKGLLESYSKFCAVELRTAGDTRSRELADAHADFEQWALSSLRFMGSERYMGAGQLLADKLMAGLKARNRAAVEALGGDLIHHLLSTHLIENDLAMQPGAQLVIPAIFIARWAQVVRESRPPGTLLSAEERKTLLRWKLVANPAVSAERRLEVAKALAVIDPDFPVLRALGARAADERIWHEAVRYYALAAEKAPEDRTLRANLAFARAHVAAGPE